jgi:hypothetical protein
MKTAEDAQEWIVKTSLFSSACLIVFFLLAPPLLSFPLDPPQGRHLIQLLIPPFLGYLVMAVRSVVDHRTKSRSLSQPLPKLFSLLLKGTFSLYLVIVIAGLLAFFFSTSTLFVSNRSISGFYFEDLSWAICAALSLQASTFAILVANVFRERSAPDLPAA